MSAVILPFLFVSSPEVALPRTGVDIDDMDTAQIVRRLANIVTAAPTPDSPVPSRRPRQLLEELARRLPEIYQDLEELYEEFDASGQLTPRMIDSVIDAADNATDAHEAYLANQRQFYRMAA